MNFTVPPTEVSVTALYSNTVVSVGHDAPVDARAHRLTAGWFDGPRSLTRQAAAAISGVGEERAT